MESQEKYQSDKKGWWWKRTDWHKIGHLRMKWQKMVAMYKLGLISFFDTCAINNSGAALKSGRVALDSGVSSSRSSRNSTCCNSRYGCNLLVFAVFSLALNDREMDDALRGWLRGGGRRDRTLCKELAFRLNQQWPFSKQFGIVCRMQS